MANPSLAVLALSVSAALSPLASAMPIGSPIHLHPRVHRTDDRVYLSLHNQSLSFREVKIDGHTYVLRAHESINIKAPVGTAVFADSRMSAYRRGDLILVVAPDLNGKSIDLN